MKTKIVWGALILLHCTALSAWAQPTAQGNFLFGTRLGFSAATSTVRVEGTTNFEGDGAASTTWNIAPQLGYFIADNFAFGIGMDYFASTTEQPDDALDPGVGPGEQSDTDLLFGPFARFYLPWATDKAVFLGVNAGFGHSSDDLSINGERQSIRNNITNLGLGLGLTIFAQNGLALETLFKYTWGKAQNTLTVNDQEQKTTAFTNAFDLGIGISYYFTR